MDSNQALCFPSIVLIYYRPLFQQRKYHASKRKPAGNFSRPPKTHTIQQHDGAMQSTPSSSELPPFTASPHIAIRVAGWRARSIVLICCMPIQNADGQHQGTDIFVVIYPYLLLSYSILRNSPLPLGILQYFIVGLSSCSVLRDQYSVHANYYNQLNHVLHQYFVGLANA